MIVGSLTTGTLMRTPVTKLPKLPVNVSDNDSGNDQNSGDDINLLSGQTSDEDELSTTSTKTNKSGAGTKESPDVLAKRMSKTQTKVQAMKKQKREDTNPSPACKCVSMREHRCV